MKLILREYLASLKERGELDAILPDLLSELGFNVFSRPARGTTQHGVDIAAVGLDEDGEHKLFLFSVKAGDLGRQDWDGGASQSLRPSLNEILDVYIQTKISAEHAHLKIVICVCLGGDVLEQVRPAVTGYINAHTNEKVSFREWNGDKLSELLLRGVLREDILPKPLRSSFQKAVAMLDEPDVSYRHFADLSEMLRKAGGVSDKKRVTSARQLYICLWIIFIWARDIDNLEAPYRISELTLLIVWDLLRPLIGKNTNEAKKIDVVLNQLIQLHLSISSELLEKKILPHVGKQDALSVAIPTRSSADVNLKLFDFLGRMAFVGLWLHWFSQRVEGDASRRIEDQCAEWTSKVFALIENNRALHLPLRDEQAIEVCLVLLLSAFSETGREDAWNWLRGMVNLLDIAVRTHGKYPCVFSEYGDLIGHPREQSDEYREEATAGSILIPLMAAWLSALEDRDALKVLKELKESVLSHCTLQLWFPDQTSEDSLYSGGQGHGVAMCGLPIDGEGEVLLDLIAEAGNKENSFDELSAIKAGCWPIVLLACRHFRHPIPPHFWINMLRVSPQNAH